MNRIKGTGRTLRRAGWAVMWLVTAWTASAQTEKVTRGDFEHAQSMLSWTTAKWGGDGTISSARDTSGDRISGSASAKISISGSDDPETAEWWHLVFTQEFSITSNRFYNGTFKIKASEPVMVQALIQRTTDPFTTVAYKTFMVGTDVQTVRFSGVSSDTTTGAIRFFFGKTKRNTQIWIDDVSVIETSPSGTTATVAVDFNTPETAADLSGLLSGTGEWYGTDSTQPGQQFVDPLKLKHWRVHESADYEHVERALVSGAKPIVLRRLNWWAGSESGNTNTPWADGWVKLDGEIDALATEYGTNIVYEVWNEPDLPDSFANYEGGTFEKYLEMFARVHNRIRAIVPAAEIIGPSLSESFDWYRLHQFMDFCVSSNLTVQGMSVHMWDSDPALEDMRADLQRLRSEIMENPAYSSVGMTNLYVTEYAHDKQRQRPGSNLAMMRLMEEGLVDGATSSCWSHLADCTDQSSCFDGTLAGLLTCDANAPRPLWWAQKWYVDGATNRVATTSTNGGIVPLASNKSGTGQVILASRGYNGAALDMTEVTVNLNNLVSGGIIAADGSLPVWVYRAPFGSYEDTCAALWDPIAVTNTTVTVSGGNASLTLSNAVNAYDAILIVFEEPAPVNFNDVDVWSGLGEDSDLNNGANWGYDGAVPSSGAVATWSGKQPGSQTLTFTSATGGAAGWKLNFTADQTDNLTIQNASGSSQNLRLKSGPSGTAGGSLDLAAGAGAVTIGGGANPIQLVLTSGGGADAELRNDSLNPLTVALNVSTVSGGGNAGMILRGTGDFDFQGNITLTTRGLNIYSAGTTTLSGTNSSTSVLRIAGNGTTVFTAAANIDGFSELRLGFSAAGGQYGTLRYEGAGAAEITKKVRIGEGNGTGAIESSGSGVLTFSNTGFNVATPSSADLTLTLGGSNTGANTIQGVIRNHSSSDATKKLSVVKTGAGKWVLSGANIYTGSTSVNEGTLIINGSTAAASTVTVATGAAIGGSGTVNGNLVFNSGAKWVFSTTDTLAVGGTASFGGFSVADVQGLGSATAEGTYTLISGTVSTNHLSNLGAANADALGDGKVAYFQEGSLQLVVTTEAEAAYQAWADAKGVTGGKADDDDEDNFTNEQEYVAGTHPVDANSFLAVESGAMESGKYEITFNTVTDRWYDVLRTPDLVVTNWTYVTNNLAGTGAPETVTDAGTPEGKAFYRIKVKLSAD